MVERFVLKNSEMKSDPGDYWVAPRYVYAAEFERLAASMRSAIAHLDQPALHSGHSGDGSVGILRCDINVALGVMRSALGSVADSAGHPALPVHPWTDVGWQCAEQDRAQPFKP
jgi:hypothetical protein